MGLDKKTILAQTADAERLLSYIDSSITYINACRLQLKVNKMRLEMGYINDQEFKKETHKLLRKIVGEVMDIRDYTSMPLFKDKFKEIAQEAAQISTNSEDITPVFIENRLVQLLSEIKETIDMKEYKNYLYLGNKTEENI